MVITPWLGRRHHCPNKKKHSKCVGGGDVLAQCRPRSARVELLPVSYCSLQCAPGRLGRFLSKPFAREDEGLRCIWCSCEAAAGSMTDWGMQTIIKIVNLCCSISPSEELWTRI
jgi:hypothetical protein